MSGARRDIDYLQDILEAIQRILDYTGNTTWQEFLVDHKTQDAIIRNLEVIGEATKKISDDIRDVYPEIPWRDITGTRDRLVHHYFGVNLEIIWQIAKNDLPVLFSQIKNVLDNFTTG